VTVMHFMRKDVFTPKFLSIFAAASAILLLAGCGAVRSASYQRGFSDSESTNGAKQTTYAAAYAYCSVIQSTLYATSDQGQAADYITGCIDYIYDANADVSSSSTDPGDTQASTESSAYDQTDVLTRLNDSGIFSWSPDKFNLLSDIPVESVYLSGLDENNQSCAVWVFADESTATSEATNGDFDWVTENYWYGDDSLSGKGIILISPSADLPCAADAASVFDWTLN
jgi:hypothetical protein